MGMGQCIRPNRICSSNVWVRISNPGKPDETWSYVSTWSHVMRCSPPGFTLLGIFLGRKKAGYEPTMVRRRLSPSNMGTSIQPEILMGDVVSTNGWASQHWGHKICGKRAFKQPMGKWSQENRQDLSRLNMFESDIQRYLMNSTKDWKRPIPLDSWYWPPPTQ